MSVVPLIEVDGATEAAIVCGLLRDAGIQASSRRKETLTGGRFGFLRALMTVGSQFGLHEVLVAQEDAEEALAVLAAQPESGAAPTFSEGLDEP